MEKREDKLNSLLEDALDDLLDDKETDVSVEAATTSTETSDEVTGVQSVKAANEEGAKKVQLNANDKKGTKGQKAGPSRKNKSKKSQNATASAAPKSSPSGMVDEEEMNRFFESMTAQLNDIKIDPEEARAEINRSVPQIFDLMQNLLSKELLYPALSDLLPKFDEWMAKNDASLSEEDKKRYTEQRRLIKEMIFVFDDESIEDREKFERNLDLMEKMQSLGSPPSELTVPNGMDKCSIM